MSEYADCQDGVMGGANFKHTNGSKKLGERKRSTCHSTFVTGTYFRFNQPHPAMDVEQTNSQQFIKGSLG